jgi:ferritin-like metal-binding protein YciE
VCLVSGVCLVDHEFIEDYEDEVKTTALISASQGVEHHEMGGSGCVRRWAERLADSEAKALLQENQTDRKLKELWETINQQAKNKAAAD